MAPTLPPLVGPASSAWSEWQTNGLRRERLAYWTDVVCRAVLDVDISTGSNRLDQAFAGQIHSRRQVNARFVSFHSSSHRLTRTRAHADRIGDEQLIVGLQCSGSARIQQERGEISLTKGDIGIVDGSRPFDIEFPAAVERRLVIVPRAMLGRAGSLVSKLRQPLRLPADAWLAPVIAQSVRTLADRQMQHCDAATSVLLNSLADMLGVQFGASFTPEEPAARDAFDRVIAHIESNLESPTLSPTVVAAAAGISLRTLHRLFRRHGEPPDDTFEQYVFDKRLSRAWRALASGEQASVTEVAFACGFSDLSHFTRRFASRFGISPSGFLKGGPRRAVSATAGRAPTAAGHDYSG